MKTKLFITLLAIIATLNSHSQSINVFIGGAVKNTMLYGIELRSENYGVYVTRYANNVDLPKKSIQPNQSENPISIVYDGLTAGINRHIECLSEVNLFAGVGMLNEYSIYSEQKGLKSMDTQQKFAFELGAGKDFRLNNMNIGIKFGVNTCTSIFGALSIGYGF